MTTKVSLPTYRELFINSETGQNSTFWYRFLSDLFNRVGGIEAASVTEISNLLDALTISVNDDKIEIAFINPESQIAELQKKIDALQSQSSLEVYSQSYIFELKKQTEDLAQQIALLPDATSAVAELSKRNDYTSSSLAVGSATSLTTATAKTVTSISLSPGDWDVSGVIDFKEAATTSTNLLLFGTSSNTNTLGADDTYGSLVFPTAGSVSTAGDYRNSVPIVRYNLATTTTIYLVAQANFTISTMTAYGALRARKMR